MRLQEIREVKKQCERDEVKLVATCQQSSQKSIIIKRSNPDMKYLQEKTSGMDLQLEQLEKLAKVPRRVFVADHWRKIVANTDAVCCKEDQEAKMDVALKRWFDIISQFPEVHETVKQLHLLAGLAEQLRILTDILSGKAPATLIKRAQLHAQVH